MNSTDVDFIAEPMLAVVAAILTIAQTVPALDKRLGHVGDLESQIGRMPFLIRCAYVWLQTLYRWILLALAVAGIVMFLAYLFKDQWTCPIFALLREGGTPLIILWLVIGTAIYTNAFSRIGAQLARFYLYVASSPVPFGLNYLGRSPDWPALRELIELNEDAKPLIVSKAAARDFVDALLRMCKENAAVKNRALPPSRPVTIEPVGFRQRVGNALLAGCVIEESHSAARGLFPGRDWGPFYAAIGDVAVNTDLFSSDVVNSRYPSRDYYREIISGLNQCLAASGQPLVPESETLIDRLKEAFSVLAKKYTGNTNSIDPGNDQGFRSRLDRIYHRVKPLFDAEAMQLNFVKLSILWDVWPNIPLLHVQLGSSKKVAALLLDRGVISVSDEVKTLAFERSREMQAQSAALRVVLAEAMRLVKDDRPQHETWLPFASRGTTGDSFDWWLTYELDLRIWEYARHLHSGNGIPGDERLTRWKHTYGQVSRVDTA
jgi:hypothetical protein